MESRERDITPEQGAAVVAEAQKWLGTAYSTVGAGSQIGSGGDCRGSTWRIYGAAGLPYTYQYTGSFPDYVASSGRFRELGPQEERQPGDMLFWTGHMALWAPGSDIDPKSRIRNDMWTASHPGGQPYGRAPSAIWFRDAPRVFRYQR